MPAELVNYVTTKRASDMLGVTRFQVVRLLLGEKLAGVNLGHTWLVYAPSVQHYLDTKSPKGRPPSRQPKLQKAT